MATVWYAQNSSANVNSANMWNDAANGSGNWLTWANLDPADTLRANGKTAIAINVNTTCAQIDTLTNGGGFTLADGITLTANVVAGTSTCLAASGTSAIVGNITAGSGALCHGVSPPGTALTVTGNVVGGSNNTAQGIRSTSTGSIAITGSVTGGSASNAHGVATTNTCTVTVTGDVTGGSDVLPRGVDANSSGLIHVIGAVSGGSGTSAAGVHSVAGHVRIDGSISAHVNGAAGVASKSVSIVDGATHYTDYAEADTTPGDVTGELIRHYGLGLVPASPATAAQFGGRFQRR